ncbi:universal stress protein [Streptomyces hygroscopicus subsp. hygroscopicus]|uniref:universal stress protein n=1 Tax=Streptomyces hygroscopicus TaxID=1912 RepID=UPI00078340DD|nr:universal stress protein [Streptomyces hygroscopicus]MBW8090732.1 universal stress protein [Streptomyces hygroscopicus subsp. hygroscopicus]
MALPLVVGVDGSESSLQAVDWAVDEAARHELPLHLVHASRWERYEEHLPSFGTDRSAGQITAENIVAACAERAALRNPDVKVSAEVLAEDTVLGLLGQGREVFAVVTGSRGRGALAETLLGSVSLAVAARAVSPVVVVRGGEKNRAGALRRVVLAVGDLVEGAAAVRFAFREARARNAALHAVRSWRRPAHPHAGQSPLEREANGLIYEEQAASVLSEVLGQVPHEHDDVTVHREVIEGPAHRVLLDVSEQADLLVVGALRRRDHTGLQLGRVSHAVLHRSACPVVIVPQQV